MAYPVRSCEHRRSKGNDEKYKAKLWSKKVYHKKSAEVIVVVGRPWRTEQFVGFDLRKFRDR